MSSRYTKTRGPLGEFLSSDNFLKPFIGFSQKYLNETINPSIFRGHFIPMVNEYLKKSNKIRNDFEEFSTFWIDLELDEFGSLFKKIHETCLYAFEFQDEEEAMPEDTFRDSI